MFIRKREREENKSVSQDQSWDSLLQKRAEQKSRFEGCIRETQMQEALNKYESACIEMRVLENQLRSRSRFEGNTTDWRKLEKFDHVNKLRSTAAGQQRSRAEQGAGKRIEDRAELREFTKHPSGQRPDRTTWRINPQSFVVQQTSRSELEELEWNLLLQRRRAIKRNLDLYKKQNVEVTNSPDSKTYTENYFSRKHILPMGDKTNLDSSDKCESRIFFQTAPFSHNIQSVRIKPLQPPAIPEHIKPSQEPNFLRVPNLSEPQPEKDNKPEKPCKQYQLTYLKASDHILYISPILSESTGYLSTYPNPALYPVNPSTSFHLSSLSCVCTLIQQTVEHIQIFDRDTRQQLETVQIKSEEKEGSDLNNKVSALKPEVLTPEETVQIKSEEKEGSDLNNNVSALKPEVLTPEETVQIKSEEKEGSDLNNNVSALKPEVLTPEEKKNISLGKMSETKLLVDLPSIPQDTVEERDLSASNDKIDNSDSDCDSSDYEYTDATESEDSSCDSGVGLAEKKRVKPATVPKVFLTSYFPEVDDPYSEKELVPFSPEEERMEGEIRNWINSISNPSSSILKDLQVKYEKLLPRCTRNPESEPKIRFVSGTRDEKNRFHGEAEIYYENGDYYWGDLEHGSREGMASLVFKNGDSLMGRFKDNQLQGFVQETISFCDRDNVVREVFYKNGVRHGFYREFGPTKQFWCFGRFNNGEKVGVHWRWGRGNVYNVGEIDLENQPEGEGSLYLYPDIKTIIQGDYEKGRMKTGRLVKLIGISKEYGVPVPDVRTLNSSRTYSYEPSSSNIITKHPMLRDPYEQRYVFVKDSLVPGAGEGLFAKVRLREGQLCSLFNGIRQRHLWGVKGENFVWSDYRIAVNRDLDMDIRKKDESLLNYRATLAHKTCHSFSPNACFNQLWHPRFGLIMSVVANRDILPGEEIRVSYNYEIPKAPQWYQDIWFQHLRYELNWSEEEINSWAAKTFRKTGNLVRIPPPPRDSSRYIPCGVCDEHVGADCSSVCCETCSTWHHIPCTNINLEEALDQGSKYVWNCTSCTTT